MSRTFFSVGLAVLAFHSVAMAGELRVEVEFLEWQWKGARPPEPFFKDGEYQPGVVVSGLVEKPQGSKLIATIQVAADPGKTFEATARIGKKSVEVCGVIREVKGDEVDIEIQPAYWQEKGLGRDGRRAATHQRVKLAKQTMIAWLAGQNEGAQGVVITVRKQPAEAKGEKNSNRESQPSPPTVPPEPTRNR